MRGASSSATTARTNAVDTYDDRVSPDTDHHGSFPTEEPAPKEATA
ncbi:hypothetical protein ACFWIQ_07325 [Kitasatospora sp. NPDC127059]